MTGRAAAYAVVRRVFEDGAWADRALAAEARGLAGRERALAVTLAYGVVQRRATLDHVIERLAGRPLSRLQPPVVAALRLGIYQLAYLDRIPAHAAVGESVTLVKADAPGGAGLVNAVLRRAAREAREIIEALPDATPQQAALKHSHPVWVAELWWARFGADGARALMAAHNRPAEAALRANTLKTGRDELLARLPGTAADGLPEGIVLTAPFDAHGDPMHADGLYMPQSRAAMAVARTLDPQPGDRVLDLCAAPGGKTTHLAALMGDDGEVVAVEADATRARHLRSTARRMGAGCVKVVVADARTVARRADARGAFDRVLVDPPCTDLGTLASRPDARWRKQAGDPERLAALQLEILRAGAEAVRPGGRLVYSTCTLSPAENEQVLESFLAAAPAFEPEPPRSDLPTWEHPSDGRWRQSLPHRDGTEGFFIATLRRTT